MEDLLQLQDIEDETLAAPADVEDEDGWEKWQSAMEDARELNDARSGAADEEYSLLADESLMQDISFIERQSAKGKVGLPNDQQLFGQIWKEAGVPSHADFQQDSVNPNQAEEDEAQDDEAEEILENVELQTSDKQEVDVLGLPCPQIRALYARDLLHPLEINRLIQEYFKVCGNQLPHPTSRLTEP